MCYKTLASAWTSGGLPAFSSTRTCSVTLAVGRGSCPRTRTLVRLTVIVPIKVRGKKRHQQRRFSNARVTAFKKPPKSRSTRTRSGFGYPCAEKAAQQSGSEKRACDAPLWLGGVLETLRSRSAAVTLRYICRGTLVRLETHTAAPRRQHDARTAVLRNVTPSYSHRSRTQTQPPRWRPSSTSSSRSARSRAPSPRRSPRRPRRAPRSPRPRSPRPRRRRRRRRRVLPRPL